MKHLKNFESIALQNQNEDEESVSSNDDISQVLKLAEESLALYQQTDKTKLVECLISLIDLIQIVENSIHNSYVYKQSLTKSLDKMLSEICKELKPHTEDDPIGELINLCEKLKIS